ncbi:hypothetical protein CCP3SC15_850001 [Gammaproteobacteria bacterium]
MGRAGLAEWLSANASQLGSMNESRATTGNAAEAASNDRGAEATEPAATPDQSVTESDLSHGEQGAGSEEQGTEGTEPGAEEQGAGSEEQGAEGAEPTFTKGAEKRIKQLLAERHELKAELDAIRTDLAAIKDQRAEVSSQRSEGAPTGENPFLEVFDPLKLETTRNEMVDLLDWAESNADGGKLGDKEFDAEQVGNIRRNARQAIHKWLPARERFLQKFSQHHEYAVKVAPWLKDTKSPDYAMAAGILGNLKGLKEREDFEYWAAAAVEGHKVLQERGKKLQAGSREQGVGSREQGAGSRAITKAPASPGGTRVVPPKGDTKAAAIQTARANVEKNRSRSALAEFLSATED